MARISTIGLLDVQFQSRLAKLFRELEHSHIPLGVFESIRSPSRQGELFARGRDASKGDYGRTVTRARAYQSAHQFGLAVDLVFHVDGEWTWDEPAPGSWDEMTRLAKRCGLETLSFERPHIQAAGFDWRLEDPGPMEDSLWTQWLRQRNGVT